jgi:PilZ domain-containing protein
MFKERRASPRYNFNRYARIQAELAGSSRDCLIVNMSDDGVRLHSEIGEIPGDFTLVIADAERPRRACRVVWRLGYEIGATFTDLEPVVAARPAAATSAA